MANMPAKVEIYMQGFCLGDFEKCARIVVAAKPGPEKAPGTLFPNDSAGAHKFVAV